MKTSEPCFLKILNSIMIGLVIFCGAVGDLSAGEAATGPLTVHPTNPRYFDDGSGKAIYLTSAYAQWCLLGYGDTKFDWGRYVDYISIHNIRLVRFMIRNRHVFLPNIYERTGPGTATDGKQKYDLTKFNREFFDRLRSRAIDLRNRGIYVVIMFFQGWDVNAQEKWNMNPYNEANNMNGIDGDTNRDGVGWETQSVPLPLGIEDLQRAFIRKIIDTVNDLDNVVYEVCNESHNNSEAWQGWVTKEIRTYEASKAKQHLVGRTIEWPGGSNTELFASTADWISPNASSGDYKDYPPASNGSKIIINDSDHWAPNNMTPAQVWKSFTRGMHPISLEQSTDDSFGLHLEEVHDNMGYTQRYADKMNLAAMTPRADMASSEYCLANPGVEYLIYLPPSGNRALRRFYQIIGVKETVTVDLIAASRLLNVEWFNPRTGETSDGGITSGGSKQFFKAPFTGDAVLYIYKR